MVLVIVEDMKCLCLNVWLINFVNLSGMVIEVVIRYGKWDKVIGLCNVLVMVMMIELVMFGKKKEELIYKFVGLNYFYWYKVVDNKGNDCIVDLIDCLYDEDNGLLKNIFDILFFKE